MTKRIVKVLLLWTLLVLAAAPAYASILIVSPHPDDDIITSSGIIHRAIARGETVKVVYMTNGDIDGQQMGFLREGEAVAAEGVLGLAEENLIFLGYPDGYLGTIDSSYPGETDLFTGPSGISATYANRGLGGTDYHSYRFGAPGAYNRFNMLMDLQGIISAYLPEHVLVTSRFDTHPDHFTTYRLLTLAVSAVHAANPAYTPTIDTTIVHWNYGLWPSPLLPDPTAYFPAIPDLEQYSELVWADRESLDVPLPMQSADYPSNPKYLAVNAHASQGGTTGPLGAALHKDEIFWPENILGTNRPPIVNAGVDQSVKPGEVAHLDGSHSRDPDGTALSFHWGQRSGPAVTLSDPTAASPAFTAPEGLSGDETLTFELVVSDDQFSSIVDAVSVRVTAQANIAQLATVTASSETSLYGQTASKAVDGVIDGYPGDVTREWVTAGEKNGAWLRLSFAASCSVNRIILYDRPNGDDNITGATLTFSDGSSVTTGPLRNDGTATEITFPAKVINALTMTVTRVSSSTKNVGLAEIEVFGILSSPAAYGLTMSINPPQSGSVSVSPSKATYSPGEQVTLTATPNAGYIFSGWSGAITGTVNPLTVTMNSSMTVTAGFSPLNAQPVAANDVYSTNGNTPLNIGLPGVLANDSDPEAGVLVAKQVTGPSHGTLTLNSDGSFSYTPSSNFAGNDSFTYVASDGSNSSDVATVTVTVLPALLSTTLSPATVTGGTSSQGTIRLNAPAPGGGIVVSLSSDTSAAAVPATVTIPALATTASFTIATTPVAAISPVTISAAYAGVTRTAALTVNPPVLTTLSITPSTVTGGSASQGTVTLNATAPSEGVIVQLTSSSTAAGVPDSVAIPAFSTSATFTISTSPVAASNLAAISAVSGSVTKTAVLNVNPPVLESLSVIPTSVKGGSTSIGTVTLSGPAPGAGAFVALNDNSSAAGVPAGVTVPAGSTSATFTITTSRVTKNTSVTINAAYGKVTEKTSLKITR